ncbi:MAG: MTH1187 family thiamine-binding protein, partial [Terriglobia bacterium]
EVAMLLELSVIPLGRGRSISADLAGLVKIIDASGLDYRLTPAGTVIEGDWDQVLGLAKKCHGAMRQKTERVITLMKVDDYEQRTGRLTAAVRSVEEKVGKPVRK